MAQVSLRDILPLAAGLGATAATSFALGGLTTYWALRDQPELVAMIESVPAAVQRPAASLLIPVAVAAQPSIAYTPRVEYTPHAEPMPLLAAPPAPPEPLQVEAPSLLEPLPVRVVESLPPPKPDAVAEAKPEVVAEAKPVLKPSTPPANGFAVQVGAFLEAGHARNMAQQLAAQGVKARVVSWTDRSGRMWFATRVGSHHAPADAQQEAAELSRHGFQTLVVRKVSGETS